MGFEGFGGEWRGKSFIVNYWISVYRLSGVILINSEFISKFC